MFVNLLCSTIVYHSPVNYTVHNIKNPIIFHFQIIQYKIQVDRTDIRYDTIQQHMEYVLYDVY